MGKVSAATNLKRRGAVYYARRRIPADLVKHYAGRTELAVSLQTKNLAEAKRRANEQWAKWEGEFQTLRLTAIESRPNTIEIDAELAEELATQWLADHLRADEESRAQGQTDREREMHLEAINWVWDDWREALAVGDTSVATNDAAAIALGLGGTADPASLRRLAYALLKARVRLLEVLDARDSGSLVDTPRAPVKRGPTLSGVLERWSKEARPTERTVSEFKRIAETFSRVASNHPVERITREHVVAFKDALVSAGRAPKTVWKACTAVGTLLRYAKRNGLVRENVAEGVVGKSKTSPSEKRLPFSPEDLAALWKSPVYSRGERPSAGGGEAAYWLPILGLLTGGRLEELGQLHVADVQREDGIHYLDINADAEGKALKTESSRRRVPLHRELIRLGFLNYVEVRRGAPAAEASDGLLFPELRPDRYGKRTGNWSKWFGRYLRTEVGIKDRRKVFHSLRHTFKSACRRASVEEELHDVLTGHVSGAVGRAYGDYPLKPLKAAVDRVGLKGPETAEVTCPL